MIISILTYLLYVAIGLLILFVGYTGLRLAVKAIMRSYYEEKERYIQRRGVDA